MIKKVLSLFSLTLLLIPAFSQSAKTRWVDSVFQTLSTNEKIGQLFMIPVNNGPGSDIDKIITEIKSHKIGGVIFTRGTPVRQAQVINQFQRSTQVPLFVAQDAEWGLSPSIDSTIQFPQPLTLGAIANDTLIYQLGSMVADQLKMVGINLNFTPVTDYDTTSSVIQYGSFGTNLRRVTDKAVSFMRGMQDQGVMTCAKYFPVQGITVIDVEKGQPIIHANVDSVKAFPYRRLFQYGLKGVVPASAEFPLFYESMSDIKKNPYSAGTLTTLYTGNWLRKNMDYRGLMFVDVQKVKVATNGSRSGDAELLAFMTGNDILMSPENIGPAIRKIKRLMRQDEVYRDQLDHTVKKILTVKFEAGLWQSPYVNTDNLTLRLNTAEAKLLNTKLYQSSVTVVKDEKNILPIRVLEDKTFAYVHCDTSFTEDPFRELLSKYVHTDYFTVHERSDLLALSDTLRHDVIIVSILPHTPKGLIERLTRLLKPLAKQHVIYCDFGNPYLLSSVDQFSTVVTAYTDTRETRRAVPQILFGALKAEGILPLTLSPQAREGTGIAKEGLSRLSYTIPEGSRMDSRVLQEIDSIAQEAIRIKATPGCQVFVAKDGKVIYEKSFGTLTYESATPVTDGTIYDLASLTKVSATLQTAMFMYEHGLIDLYKKVSHYLPELKNSNKKDITLIDMLTHQSGLAPFIPLWPQTVKDTTFLPLYYSRSRTKQYPLQVSPTLFASSNIRDSVWVWVTRSKMADKPPRTPYAYRYSDLGFIILQQLAEKLLNQPIDEFLKQNLYDPLGAYTTGFTPLDRFPVSRIAPTEDDKIFRRTFVSGTVHDERAAMMGGVAGHAGLFSNASDLAKLGQMLLQGGYYGGYRYYRPETVQLFTARTFETSRRGIGWDKPMPSDANSPTSVYASPKTFGHTGFTGTCMWIDPEFNLVYIFLSNRVYPDRNNKLSNANIRSRIQDVLYKSIFSYSKNESPDYLAKVQQ